MCFNFISRLHLTLLLFLLEYAFAVNVIVADGNGVWCPENDDCEVTCGYQQCLYLLVQCPSGYNCTIHCNDFEGCKASKIRCPIDSNCILNCTADYACYDASITWPTSGYGGQLICEGREACRETNFPIPNPNIPLTVTCDNLGECFKANIICPTDASCTVNCDGESACAYCDIHWPSDITVTSKLNCISGTNVCIGSTIEPTIDDQLVISSDYTLNCNSDSECEAYIINCPINHGCYITCNATAACRNMVINWVQEQPHNIICGEYERSCQGVHISNSDNNKNLNLVCSADYQCYDTIIDCPANAQCNIECSGSRSCWRANINWVESEIHNIECVSGAAACRDIPNISSTNMTLDCGSNYICAGSTINCPQNAPCTIHCDSGGGSSCRFAIINGPIDYPLTIFCDYNNACQFTTINAEKVSQFTMNGCYNGVYTCYQQTIYFPPNVDGTKIAVFNGAGRNNLAHYLNWYAINGWLDINITTDYMTGSFAGEGSVLYCGTQYDKSCNMSTTQWFGDCGICDNPLTNAPSGVTTTPTSIPTITPTFVPTEIPTATPSYEPSNLPSDKTTAMADSHDPMLNLLIIIVSLVGILVVY